MIIGIMNKTKGNTIEHLNEYQENINKELNEIKRTVQDMKDKINKDTEIPENKN
jgi:hypothetical protein